MFLFAKQPFYVFFVINDHLEMMVFKLGALANISSEFLMIFGITFV